MPSTTSLHDKTVLVTGGTGGIGRATAAALAALGARVIVTGRDLVRGQIAAAELAQASGNPAVEFAVADFASMASVRALAENIGRRVEHLDVLVNNAGIAAGERRVTGDGLESMFQVNYLSAFQLTTALLPLLAAGAPARVVNVATVPQKKLRLDFGDLQGARDFNALAAYGRSKLALTLFTYELARRQAGALITANALEPGWVKTAMTRTANGPFKLINTLGRPLQVSPERAARTPVHLAASADVANVTGAFYSHKQSRRASSPASYDADDARRLWTLSEDLLNRRPAVVAD